MKTILFFLVLCSVTVTYSQTKPATYVFVDAGAAYGLKNASLKNPAYTYINPYFGKTFGKKGTFGIFVESFIEPEAFSINPGLLFVTQKRSTYHEAGIGPGFEFPKNSVEGEKVVYFNSYYYLENHADEMRAKGKLILSANYSYAKEWGNWWLIYGVYYFNKWFAAGLHTQRYATTGLRIQATAAGNAMKETVWIAGNGEQFTIGLTVSGQWFGK